MRRIRSDLSFVVSCSLVCLLGAASQEDTADVDREAWAQRMAQLKGAGWRQAFGLGLELAALPPDEGYEILAASWPHLDVQSKQQLLKAFNYKTPYPLHARMHARFLAVLHLGVTDEPEVAQWSFTFLKGIAFRDFAEDFTAYRAWHQDNRGRPIRTVAADACGDYVTRLAEARGERARRLASLLPGVWSVFRDVAEVRQAAVDAGLLDVVRRWAAAPDTDGRALGDVLQVMAYLEPGEAYLREVVLAAAREHKSPEVRIAAQHALGNPAHAWAVDDLLEIPELPDRPPAGRHLAAGADLPVQDVLAGGDRRQRYFLMGPRGDATEPEDGWRLLLVLPGGDGGADFRPFVENIARQAAPDGYLVAELVAPQWCPQQAEHVVWPTAGLPWPQAGFTTEQFIDAVIDDIGRRYRLDLRDVHTLSWSSGGPAAYAASVAEGTRITGSLVAMSVFKPQQLSGLERARGRKYYILHSPQDFIAMRFPEAARDQLAAHGATTTLVTYEGGHGWHGDVFGNIRKGLVWLETE